jgi:hypothetical protein
MRFQKMSPADIPPLRATNTVAIWPVPAKAFDQAKQAVGRAAESYRARLLNT